MNAQLTSSEEDVIKDVLKAIGKSPALTRKMAGECNMTVGDFNCYADAIFTKLGNGRLTVEES